MYSSFNQMRSVGHALNLSGMKYGKCLFSLVLMRFWFLQKLIRESLELLSTAVYFDMSYLGAFDTHVLLIILLKIYNLVQIHHFQRKARDAHTFCLYANSNRQPSNVMEHVLDRVTLCALCLTWCCHMSKHILVFLAHSALKMCFRG